MCNLQCFLGFDLTHFEIFCVAHAADHFLRLLSERIENWLFSRSSCNASRFGCVSNCCIGIPKSMVPQSVPRAVQFHQNWMKLSLSIKKLSSKNTFIKNHFHQKPLSSKTTFIQTTFIKIHFHPKRLSSENHFHQKTTFIKFQFRPKCH